MPAFVKLREAGARDQRVRILHGGDELRDARLDDGVGAGAGAPLVRTGFERDVQVAPRAVSPASSSAAISACFTPVQVWKPRPTTSPFCTMTAPTAGFGLVRPRPWRRAPAPLPCVVIGHSLNRRGTRRIFRARREPGRRSFRPRRCSGWAGSARGRWRRRRRPWRCRRAW